MWCTIGTIGDGGGRLLSRLLVTDGVGVCIGVGVWCCMVLVFGVGVYWCWRWCYAWCWRLPSVFVLVFGAGIGVVSCWLVSQFGVTAP